MRVLSVFISPAVMKVIILRSMRSTGQNLDEKPKIMIIYWPRMIIKGIFKK